jgi:NAD(P)-dependent dehydrogenase (short-subunit alcohol dehydrogenase family)
MINTLVVGGLRGIGKALVDELLATGQHQVVATSRQAPSWSQSNDRLQLAQLDLADDDSMAAFSQCMQENHQSLDWLINCAGVLHSEQFQPEKTFQHFTSQRFEHAMRVNGYGHLLLIKALAPLLLRGTQPLVASVSARIGSIADNQLGGWHAYRMSKAALNQGMKTLGIEWARKYPKARLMLLHPGTTDTDLSKPFQRNLPDGQLQSPQLTAQRLIRQINQHLTDGITGTVFVDYQGHPIPW